MVVSEDKSMIFATNAKGRVFCYIVDYNKDSEVQYRFSTIDECDFFENPHGRNIDGT